MSTKLSDYIKSKEPIDPAMPLMHGTDHYRFEQILEAGELRPTKCPVFEEDLLYLFYGRPGYRGMINDKPQSRPHYLPVCFILKTKVSISAKRIYPFDTGGFGLYSGYLHSEMSIDSFLLGSASDLAPRTVNAFFGSNRNYYLGALRTDLDPKILRAEVQAYCDLVAAMGETTPDDRRYTLEIQSTSAIKLPATVEAVVLSNEAMERQDIFDAVVKGWNATPLTYPTYNGLRPREYHGRVVDEIFSYLKGKKYL